MVSDTLSRIEKNILNAQNIEEKKKTELLALVYNLKKEMEKLGDSEVENAQTIANFTKASTHEAVKENRNEELADLSVKALSLSAKKFEASHPDLVSAVNSVCTFLSNMGI
jgi:hypothetical protein